MQEQKPAKQNNSDNPDLSMAQAFVEQTDCHLFLTGKAGTGKTTFLKHLKKNSAKRMIVTAPTGVAAINAGGVTLHSFFQLPFGPFVPGTNAYGANREALFRFNKEKKQIINSLDLLVIDEISMVRADMLDAVDAALKYHRRSDAPFGGVQLLMIGDLFQLPPVAKSDEWALLSPHYGSVYFFSSQALNGLDLITIELKRIYRQTDHRFIEILNQVRENRLDQQGVTLLNQRVVPGFTPDHHKGHITLTTHNHSADHLNQTRLNQLKVKTRRLDAQISGEFPPQNFPTQETLSLKIGAQVMFLRNDTSQDRRYFNGKIGKITRIDEETITVQCDGDSEAIDVSPVLWENIKYRINEETKEIEEDIIGTFTQFPLKLAWAVTIHKSQGLTFDKAVIDIASAFTHGQVYVALSRCRTLDGMVLSSPVPSQGIAMDGAVTRFTDQMRHNAPTTDRLVAAREAYQQRILLTCFDFNGLNRRLSYLVRLIKGNAHNIQVSGASHMDRVATEVYDQLVKVGDKFRQQLQSRFTGACLPEEDPYIRERVIAASAWFREKFTGIFDDFLDQFTVETDNKEIRKRVNRTMDALRQEIAIKQAVIQSCDTGFSPDRYLKLRAHAAMDTLSKKTAPARNDTYTTSDIEHPELFQILKEWRGDLAREKGVPPYQIMHQRILIQIVVHLPKTPKALLEINGIGKKTMEKYGKDILERVTTYRNEKGIQSVTLPPPRAVGESNEKTGIDSSDTKQISYTMFRKGSSPDQIAAERGLSMETIQKHLGHFVEEGKIHIDELMSPEKQRLIIDQLSSMPDNRLKPLKEALGDQVSYWELRLVMASEKNRKSD